MDKKSVAMKISIYNLNTSATKYNMEISTKKKVIAFQEQELIPSTVCIGNRIIE
jgi:hypothetical protein